MGILSILTASMCGLGVIFGIIGLKMSKTDLLLISNGQMDSEGKGLTQAGRICSIIGLCWSGVILAIAAFYVIFSILLAGAMAVSGAGANP